MPDEPINNAAPTRRDFLSTAIRGCGLLAAGGLVGVVAAQAHGDSVWQIDPLKCIQCGKCATDCVLNPSAVRCLNVFPMCGYCKLCTGYFEADPNALNEGAENQLCPTGALLRNWVEDQYYEYTIDTKACIGCAKCVKGCVAFGNGSLFLQIDQKLCVHCNQCSIARVCPSQAIARVPADKPYIMVDKPRGG
jgi:electron transport complex protein RnfB